MHRGLHVRLLGACAGLVLAPVGLAAQHLTPVTDAERCHGERIVEVVTRGGRRAVLGHPEELARVVNGTFAFAQPLTPDRVVRNFLLFRTGDACTETARHDSERILRAQPFISDVAIRAEPAGRGAVRLVVETIDEYMIRAEAWGISGVPVGTELGTANLFGGARGLSFTGEVGRGGDVGFGAKFTDYQAFGKRVRFDAWGAARPLVSYGGVQVVRSFITDLQPYAWLVNATQSRSYYTFHETSIRDVSLQFDARNWAIGGMRRWPHDTRGFQMGAVVTGTYADPIRTVAIRENGPEPVVAPALTDRYHAFSALRVGVAGGFRAMRYLQVTGLSAFTSTEDIGIGWQSTGMLLQGIGVFPGMAPDRIGVWNLGASAGGSFFQVWGGTEVEARFPGTADPVSTLGSASAGALVKVSGGHTTALDVELAGGANSRIPMQLTFRDDDGLLGYRSSDVGGGHRTIWRFEDRWLVPSPLERAELAVAALAQAGKLDAGDALYGVATPWRYGAGIALIAAIPRGSKHKVRLEFGWPLNPAGSAPMEVRITYSDGAFGGIPSPIVNAREAQSAARAVTP